MEPEVQGVEPEFVVDPDDPRWVDPGSNFDVHFANDWVTDPATVLYFDEGVVGREGGQELAVVPQGDGVAEADMRVDVSPGSELPAGSVLIATGGRATIPSLQLNVVGGSGLTSVLL